jgi:hypothetical protein
LGKQPCKGKGPPVGIIGSVVDTDLDPHHFGKLDPHPHQSGKLEPDPDPHQSEKQFPDTHQSEKVEALEGNFGAVEGPDPDPHQVER